MVQAIRIVAECSTGHPAREKPSQPFSVTHFPHLVASMGLYGITAYSVVRRTGEIGIRMALGAARRDIVAMVLRGAFLQTGIRLLIGIPAALAGGRVLAHQLYGIQPRNPLMLGAATLLLAAYAFIAGLIPALRAAGVDPIRALRTE